MDAIQKEVARMKALDRPSRILIAVPAVMMVTALFIPELRMVELDKGIYVFGNFAKGQHLNKDGTNCGTTGFECYSRSHTTWRCGALTEEDGPADEFFNAGNYDTAGKASTRGIDICRAAVGYRWTTAGLGIVAHVITIIILRDGIDSKTAPPYRMWGLIGVYLVELGFAIVLIIMLNKATHSSNIWRSDNPKIHWEYWVTGAVNLAAVLTALCVTTWKEFALSSHFHGKEEEAPPAYTNTNEYAAAAPLLVGSIGSIGSI